MWGSKRKWGSAVKWGATGAPPAFQKAVSAGVAFAGSIGKAAARGVSSSVALTATVGRVAKKALSSGIAFSGSLAYPFVKAVSAGVALSSGINRAIRKVVSRGIALSASAGRKISRLASAGIMVSGETLRKAQKGFYSSVALSATAGRRVGKGVLSAISLPVTLGRVVKRGISKSVALSVALGRSTSKGLPVTTLVLSAAVARAVSELLEKGLHVAATVVRVVKKPIQAGVALIGYAQRMAYDMAWEMNKAIRKILAKVAITYSDPFFSAGLTAEATETGDYTYPAQTTDNVEEEAFKWFSLHQNDLSGSYHPLPAKQEYSVGWWNATLCDAIAGTFAVPPILTISHSARPVESLLVVGDDKLEEYPVDFWVRLYSEGDVLEYEYHETANADVRWTKDVSATDIVKHELEIVEWSRPGSVAKIAQFFTMLEETYESESGDLFSVRVLEEREFTGTTIPQGNISSNEIRVRLNNIDDVFTAGNMNSRLQGLLLNNRAIKAWLGCDLRSGERIWFPLGTFFSRDWSTPEGETYAEVSGLDMLDRLKQTEFSTSQVYENVTLHDLAIIIMADAGLTDADWEIDPVLDTAAYTIPYAWFDRMSHRAALKLIAEAALGQVYCDRDGKVVVTVYTPPERMPASDFHFTEGNTFEIDHPLSWSQMVNYVQAQAAPLTPSAEDDICVDVEEFTVPGLGTTTKTHFFDSSPCVDVVDPLVFVNTGGHVSLDSMTVYAWGVNATYSNSDVADETVTSVTIRGKRLEAKAGRAVVAQDAGSIASNGKQTLPSPISSAFWQTEAQAQAAVDALLAYYKDPRRDVVMRARGNIASLLGDRVVAPDYRDLVSAEYGLLRQDINYDGGLEVAVVGQRIPDGTVTHYKSIAAGVVLSGSATTVIAWEDLLATVTVQGVVARKFLETKGLSSGVGLQSTVSREVPMQARNIAANIGAGGSIGRKIGKGASSGIVLSGSIQYDTEIPAVDTYGMVGEDGYWPDCWEDCYASSLGYPGLAGIRRNHETNSTWYSCRRGMLVFETGDEIPVGATIVYAHLWIKVSAKNVDRAFSLQVQLGSLGSPHVPVIDGDYNKDRYSGDGGSILTSDLPASGWVKIELNATGISWIQKGAGAITRLALRGTNDINDDPPPIYPSQEIVEWIGSYYVDGPILRVLWYV